MPVSWAEWAESVQAVWRRGESEDGFECPIWCTTQLCPADAEQLGVCVLEGHWVAGGPAQALSSAHLGAVALCTCRQADTVTAPG